MSNKICPFCKESIDKSASTCPHCKMVVMERVGNPFEVKRKEPTSNVSQRSSTKATNYFRTYRIPAIPKYVWIAIVASLVFIGLCSIGGSSPSSAPNIPARNYVTLPNGTVIHSTINGSSSLGTLEIDNGTSEDAVTKLMNERSGKSVFSVYIQANSKYTIAGISDGLYDLYFQTGKDWEATSSKFLVGPSFSKFRDNFPYTTTDTRTYDGINTSYTTFRVTLNPVISGTAKTDEVTEEEFSKL